MHLSDPPPFPVSLFLLKHQDKSCQRVWLQSGDSRLLLVLSPSRTLLLLVPLSCDRSLVVKTQAFMIREQYFFLVPQRDESDTVGLGERVLKHTLYFYFHIGVYRSPPLPFSFCNLPPALGSQGSCFLSISST